METILTLFLIALAIGLFVWLIKRFGPTPPVHDSTAGSARWADAADLRHAGLISGQGIFLGQDEGPERAVLHYRGDKHLLTCAPTRSGKGTSAIVPNLLTYPGSVLVIDPKGENAAITARRRRELGQTVHVLNPWGLCGLESAAFNPLDFVANAPPEEAYDNARLVADALVLPGASSDAYWTEEAKSLLTGMILYVCTAEGETPTLGRVRALLTLHREDFVALLARMSVSEAAAGLVARAANRQLQKADREASSVVSMAQQSTDIFDSPNIARVTEHSTFSFADLKASPTSVYLVLPSARIPSYGRWLRLMVSMALTALTTVEQEPERPVLFLLDEFAALGRLQSVETAYGLLAGFGVQLWAFVQDLAQLEDLYGRRWQSFIANAGVLQTFGTRDMQTAKYVSDACGVETRVSISEETAEKRRLNADYRSMSDQIRQRQLIFPDELLRLQRERQLLLVEHTPPVLGRKLAYYDQAAGFAGMFDPNPYRRAGAPAPPESAAPAGNPIRTEPADMPAYVRAQLRQRRGM